MCIYYTYAWLEKQCTGLGSRPDGRLGGDFRAAGELCNQQPVSLMLIIHDESPKHISTKVGDDWLLLNIQGWQPVVCLGTCTKTWKDD